MKKLKEYTGYKDEDGKKIYVGNTIQHDLFCQHWKIIKKKGKYMAKLLNRHVKHEEELEYLCLGLKGNNTKGWNGLIRIGDETRAITEYPEKERLHIWNEGYEAVAKYIVKKVN